MDDTQRLLALEALKSLKAKYFRTMDSKDWPALSSCFTEDLQADFTEAPGMLAEGRDNYMAQLTSILQDAQTMHHGHMPELTIISDDEAQGVWAMEDIVQLPDLLIQGWGHYHERYRKEAGEWKISHIKLTRLRLLMNGEVQDL